MKKIELLSPAGDIDTLKLLVLYGADAIYIGGTNYGARKYAKNFTNEEIVWAIKYCHLYQVKLYVTVNTIIYDNEVDDFISYVTFLHENGIDAVIMQDIGMIKLVSEILPNLEIHASTQCHNHNNYGLNFLYNLGVKRAVMARELSLTEINKMDSFIEKEVFIHGALCVSYSGQCYFSSFNGGRSGNRGECVGCCRLPYKLLENDKLCDTLGNYLLSMKDLNTVSNLKEILDSNICSLKIEGRMKSKEYVLYVTYIYRKLIDSYYDNKITKIKENELNNLKVLFNREFTSGYLNNNYGSDVMNIKTSNHKGINLGKVIDVDNKKIKILLYDNLNQNDGIRFEDVNLGMMVNYLYDKNDNLVNHALKGDIIYLDNKINLNINNILVSKTIDSKLNSNILTLSDKRISIFYKIKALMGEKLEITVSDNINEVTIYGNVVFEAIKIPTNKFDIEKCLLKLGNTIYKCDNIDIKMDNNIFIPLSELNNLRRDVLEKLNFLKENNKKEVIKKCEIINKIDNINTNYLQILVRGEDQLKYLLDKNVIIITDNINLYNKYKDLSNVYYRTSRVSNNKIEFNNDNLYVTELGAINKYSKNNNLISSIYLNITNYKSVNLIINNNVKLVNVSRELSYNQVFDLVCNYKKHYNEFPNIGVFIYGRIELMITKYCISNMIINKDNKKCSLCKNNTYKLESNNNIYPILHNNCINYILDYKNIDELDKINDYKKIGINNFIISLYDEDINDIDNLLKKVQGI